ncbi:proteinase-activated receptor 1 [Tupaia chinensis]|uniref:proteinase-activated receptor 1 n=1 Tax=Tupaia chinensis TaxID=246437 RepID=UPI000FFC508B|nr:proteinase-activated receptor 1 [Tupaia chinensis]
MLLLKPTGRSGCLVPSPRRRGVPSPAALGAGPAAARWDWVLEGAGRLRRTESDVRQERRALPGSPWAHAVCCCHCATCFSPDHHRIRKGLMLVHHKRPGFFSRKWDQLLLRVCFVGFFFVSFFPAHLQAREVGPLAHLVERYIHRDKSKLVIPRGWDRLLGGCGVSDGGEDVLEVGTESKASNATVDPRSFSLRKSSGGFEPLPLLELEKNESRLTEDRLASINQSRPLQKPLAAFISKSASDTFISKSASGYLTSSWLTLFVPSVYTGVCLVSLPLNILAIVVFILKMKVKKPAVVYMLHLAVADVLFVSMLPFRISYYFSGSDWQFGSAMCRFVTAAFYCNMYASIMLMTAISIDRFMAVVYPIQSLSWRSLGRASFTCLAIWAMAIAGVVPLLLKEQTMQVPGLNITTCHDVLNETLLEGYYAYYFSAFSAVFFFVPLTISTVCYVSIIRCLSSSTVTNRSNKSRALFLSATVFCIFLICFGPTNILLIVHYAFLSHSSVTEATYFAYLLCVCVSSISCCIDPLIYYYASCECQRYLYSILCCKESSDPGSYNSSGQLMASKIDTSSSHLSNSIYKKLLT